jgi:hypothetical protein
MQQRRQIRNLVVRISKMTPSEIWTIREADCYSGPRPLDGSPFTEQPPQPPSPKSRTADSMLVYKRALQEFFFRKAEHEIKHNPDESEVIMINPVMEDFRLCLDCNEILTMNHRSAYCYSCAANRDQFMTPHLNSNSL